MSGVRKGEIADAKRATRLLLDFHKTSGMPFPASAAWAHNLFCECVTDPARLALVCDGGVLLAVAGPSLLGPFKQAQEIAWWIDPSKRGRGMEMLIRYEQWAINMGAKIVSVASLEAMPNVGTIYSRRGFSRMETHWSKVVE